jgi:hypothetical protein
MQENQEADNWFKDFLNQGGMNGPNGEEDF